MARMIPFPIRRDVKSPAERRLYEMFNEQLPADWTVFHNIPWQARDVRYGAKDGETDFVLAHPDYGILILEVKGGQIRYDGASGQWHSNEYTIKDPFEQARNSKYSLLDVLKEQPYWRTHWITIGHAVAFPDVDIVNAQRMLRPDAPGEIIMDKGHTKDLASWVKNVFHYWYGQESSSSAPGPNGIKEVELVLSPSFFLKALLSSEIEDEQEELLRVTEEQFDILNFLCLHRRAAVSGCAGSGKTLIAVEKAKRLAQQGFSVLFTCFNYNLAVFLRENLTDYPTIYVYHFHGLCRELARKAGLLSTPDRVEKSQSYYDEILPSLLVDAADRLDWRVDAIIVDEGQDFNEEWDLSLRYLLRDPDEGIMYIFFDDNQNLYRSGQSVPLEKTPFSLSKNCRNTKLIHTFTQKFYLSDHPITAMGPQGRAVQIERYDTTEKMKQHIRHYLHQLIIQEKVQAQDIVILTPKAPDKSMLGRLGTVGNFRLVDRPTGASGEVFYTTIHQYKGLESPVVILAEMEPEYAPDMKKLLYIGSSRACNHLIVIAHHELSL
jgi:hypothetical protein